ncbi:MAG: SusD/RagB family nutrient-binding outer membrane lipoprotein [Chitinophagaceae bacterium]
MKKHSIINWALLLASVSFTGTGCKKALDINHDPNNVVENNITAPLVLPQALHAAGNISTVPYFWLNHWMGYWAPAGDFAPNAQEQTYNIDVSFQNGHWINYYNTLYDLTVVERKAAENNEPYYRAVAMIMKAFLFQGLVDIYGNVPYSQAFNAAISTPVYDDGQAIYNDLQLKLNEAIALIKDITVSGPSPIKTTDIMFHGDAAKWVKLANTLKLRLLIRQSQVPGFNPAAEIARIQANGFGFLMSGESAAVNPGYLNDVNKQSPFYGAYGFLPDGTAASSIERANAYIINVLKSNNDPRLGYFFRPATSPVSPSNPYAGNVYGSPPTSSSGPTGGTRLSTVGEGLARTAFQDQWVLTSVESMFLQAEAVQRGWLPGSAQAAYEDAVRESFKWLGVPNAVSAANSYLASATIADWGSATNKVSLIIYQKYLALCGVDPLEAWSDHRRLGIPAASAIISADPVKISGVLPVRLLYPASEYAVNAANVLAQGSVNQFSSNIFWDK